MLVSQGDAVWLHRKTRCHPQKKKPACAGDPSAWAHAQEFAINNMFVSLSVAKYQQRVNFSPLLQSVAGISAQDGLTARELDPSH